MKNEKLEVFESSGNVFADFGLPDAEERLLKSSIVIELRRLIKERKLTQTKAAGMLAVSQPDLSNILRGRLDNYSSSRLMRMLTVFEQDIEIVMKPHRKRGEVGQIIFKSAAA